MWIDSHCHLNHPRIREEGSPQELIARAKAEGVDGMLTISCRISEEYEELCAIAGSAENVWCSIGTHPHDAGMEAEKAITLGKLIEMANADAKIIGIGESGLDYYYDHSPRADQQESFRKHIRACIETGLPLIIHSRDAEEDTMRILHEERARAGEKAARLKGVMHCFSSRHILAEEALKIGFYISFSGIVTFKKSTELQESARQIPLDRLLVETDSPFLAPQPLRGKTCRPEYVGHTGAFLADLLGLGKEEFAKVTTENFYRLFDRAAP